MDASFSLQSNHGIMDEEKQSLSESVASSSDVSSDSMIFSMASLMKQLPFKKGLSKHFQGKSQSFTSLSNVRSLEDLAKPEKPYKKKLKSCKRYGGLEKQRLYRPRASSRAISKKGSRSSCPWLVSKRNSLLGNKPPIPTHRIGSFSNQTPLFA